MATSAAGAAPATGKSNYITEVAQVLILLTALVHLAHAHRHHPGVRPWINAELRGSYRSIWAAQAGRIVTIDDIRDPDTDQPSPYRVEVDFGHGDVPRVVMTVWRGEAQLVSLPVKPRAGWSLSSQWISYALRVDGLDFRLGINPFGVMPIQIFDSPSSAKALFAGRATLEGGRSKCDGLVGGGEADQRSAK